MKQLVERLDKRENKGGFPHNETILRQEFIVPFYYNT